MKTDIRSEEVPAETDQINQEIRKLKNTLEEHHTRWLRFELPDTHGIARSKVIPVNEVESFCRSGVNMYGGTLGLDVQSDVVPGTGYGEEIRYADHFLFPDYDTFSVIPWMSDTGRILCTPKFSDGRTCAAAPRVALKRILDDYQQLGFQVKSAHELEFYVLDPKTHQPVFDGKHIFSNLRNSSSPLLGKILDYLPEMGINLRTANCEYAPGQLELTVTAQLGLQASDTGYTIKNSVKEIAQSMDLLATFMSKPFAHLAGCGSHYHCSLVDELSGKNLFADESSPDGLSTLCRHFVGGLTRHLGSIMALLAPTLNCYKRYRPHTFAPINVSWGFEDRTAAIRIKAGKGDAAHLENRIPSGSSNPYLAALGTLSAGLLGIRNKIEPAPLSGEMADSLTQAPPLPKSLSEALNLLEEDDQICELLGGEFVQLFTAVKRYEIDKFNEAVTDFEINEYLEFL